ncbi:hypothetical protein HHX47_DHR3000992 [Lentinula edodes]|nr:hypothetical protein HHX47_DHR3000992 [Lentinula edodes]
MPLVIQELLSLGFLDFVRGTLDTMTGSVLYYLTAMLASTSVLQSNVGVQRVAGQYLLGLGIGDITGPVVETNMMGYASLAQTDTGLHMRQRSRVFIVAEEDNPSNTIVFINSDIAMGDTGVRRSIVSNLTAMYPGVYTNENIAFVGTHQHSGVGGYLENLLPQITSLGYVAATANAIVQGTVLAVQRAHNSLAPGSLSLGNTTVLNANINRSPSAYLANPAEERAQYEFDQDKELTLLRFDDASGNARGFLSFFAVHGTSLYENNTLVSGDNKGMAAYLYEAMIEPDAMPGNATFVAGFTQANVGDTSPNTLGAFCESPGESYDGMVCDFNHSTCGGTVEDCHGRGPGFRISDFASNEIIAQYQVDGAQTVMEASNRSAVTGSGYADLPYQWSPSTVDIQMLRVGQLVMLVMPGELTTMSGRRIRQAVRSKLISSGVLENDAYVVIAGPANTYAHYVATLEEYSVQRYEGASTIFGQYTLDAYIDKYTSLVPFIADTVTGTPASDAPPAEQTSKAISLQLPVVFDSAPFGSSFGQIQTDVGTTPYQAGQTVFATFVGANPRNNLRLEETFFSIDRLVSGAWQMFRSDSHPSTTYSWVQTSTILGTSQVNITWSIENGTPAGTYRIRYFGDSKPLIGSISSFVGQSGNFTIS